MRDEPEHSQLLALVYWWTGTRSKVLLDLLSSLIKRPQSNAEKSKCFEMLEGSTLIRLRQQYNGGVGKKAITMRLHQSFTPIAKLHLEGQQFWINRAQKVFRQKITRLSRQTTGIPHDDDEVCDPVSIRWNLSGARKCSLSRAKEPVSRCADESPAKAVREYAFATPPGRMLRQIPQRIVKPKARYPRRASSCHRVGGASTRYTVTSPRTTYLPQNRWAVNNRLL